MKKSAVQYLSKLQPLTKINLFISIVLALGAIAVIFFISKRISIPVKQATLVTGQLQNGEFSSRVNLVGRLDEVGVLCQSLDVLAGDLQKTVADVNQVMGYVARGDLSCKSYWLSSSSNENNPEY